MLDSLKRAYDYLKGVRETREVQSQLRNVLQSLDTFADSADSAMKNGKELRKKAKALDPPITLTDVTDLMTLSIKFNEDFCVFLSSISDFGRECHGLVSGDFEAFMQRVKTRKRDVYDIINFFGRNYDPNKKTLDLTRLPMLIRIYGPKGAWKENKRLSEEVSRGKKEIDAFNEKARIIKNQRIPFRDRILALSYVRSYQRLGREAKTIVASKETAKELKRNAPSWYVELVEIGDTARKALPGKPKSSLP